MSSPRVRLASFELDVAGKEPEVPLALQPVEDGKKGGRAKNKKWIVQFTGPVHEADKAQLAALGCRVGDYLPDYSFIATMDDQTKVAAEGLSSIRGIVRYKPAYKIHGGLKDSSGAVTLKAGETVKLRIKLDGKESQALALAAVQSRNGKVLDVSGDLLRVEVGREEIAALSQIEEVLWVEEAPDLHLFNDTTSWTIQTDLPGNTKVWNNGLHGEGQIVGIGDTGLDYDSCFFRDPSGAAIGPTHRKVFGYDSTYGDDYDANSPGHGTHVAGTVAGDRTPIDGTSSYNGAAPKARVFMQDLTLGSSKSVFPPSDLGLLFITAYDQGARLHTNSWGGGASTYDSMSMSADRFMWDHKDFLALFANGNAGPNSGTVGPPAIAKNVVSVGATLNGGGSESVTGFSSNGPTADGRIKPTVAAPGDGVADALGITSADSDGVKNDNNCTVITMRGTSMATPAVAGAAALVRQYYQDGFYPTGAPTPANSISPSAALVKATLVNSAQNMTGANTDDPMPSTGQGWGRVNLSNALSFTGDTRGLIIADMSPGLSTGQSWTQGYYVPGTYPLKATLVWTDYPGTVGAATALVNDLDLSVTAPNGVTTYLGNVFANASSTTGGSADRLNVEEQVLLSAPTAGFYTFRVTAFNVPNGPQPFAVVITGVSDVSSTGRIGLDRARYNGSASVQIAVSDRDLNLSSAAIDHVTVTIASTTEPAGESVQLTETGADTSVFVGTIPLRVASASPNDGYLEVANGATITATYQDADDGTGHSATVTATAVVDLVAPVISAVSTGSVMDRSAEISWTTNEPATTVVDYGVSTSLGNHQALSALATQHSVALTGLSEATTYYFQVTSVDEAGNSTIDNHGGAFYSFSTSNAPPSLTVNPPNGTTAYTTTILIYGTATDPSGVASVTVNGSAASYRPSDGYYERSMPLSLGANTFTVVATDTRGNVATQATTITRVPAPDLVISSVSGPTSAGNGASIVVNDTVCNNGAGGASSYVVGLYLSADAVVSTGDTFLGGRTVSSLASGLCSSGSTTFVVPAGMTAGAYYLGAVADYNNTQDETDETNNALAGNAITVTPGADLIMTSISGPTSGVTGGQIAISNTIKNQGTGDASAPSIWVGFYLSTDNVITTSDIFIDRRAVSFILPVGASDSATTTVSIPTGIAPGTYYLGAIADYPGGVSESNETNNGLAGNTITVTPGVDLVMTSASGPTSGATGSQIAISNTIRNQGTGNPSALIIWVGFYLSTDNMITTSDIYLGRRATSNGLAAGASNSASTTVTIPTGIAPGTYYLGAIADYPGGVPESNETNNGLAGNAITVTIGADLVMTTASGPTSGARGSQIAIANTMRNQGTGIASALAIWVGLYLSTDNAITTSDIYLGRRATSNGLAAGASDPASTTVSIPTGIAPGTYYLGAIADYPGGVPESDETNNGLAGNTITVTP